MLILGIETSTNVCSVAAVEDGVCLMQQIDYEGQNHARLLSRFVQRVLDELKQQGRHLDAVALSQGPGSYTGLRIGTATAKGLCYGMDLSLFAVDTLQAIAMSARQKDSDAGSETLYCPMIDARRMEVYTALYDAHLNQTMPVEARIITQDSLSSLSAGREVVLCGNGAGKCRPMLPQGMNRLMEDIVPEARYVAELASDAARGYQAVDLAYFNPFYLKEFQAVVSKNKLW